MHPISPLGCTRGEGVTMKVLKAIFISSKRTLQTRYANELNEYRGGVHSNVKRDPLISDIN